MKKSILMIGAILAISAIATTVYMISRDNQMDDFIQKNIEALTQGEEAGTIRGTCHNNTVNVCYYRCPKCGAKWEKTEQKGFLKSISGTCDCGQPATLYTNN